MYISNMFCLAQLYTNGYFLPNSFLKRVIIFVFHLSLARTTDEVEHPWGLFSNGELLGVLRYNFSILQYKQRYPTYEQHGAVSA